MGSSKNSRYCKVRREEQKQKIRNGANGQKLDEFFATFHLLAWRLGCTPLNNSEVDESKIKTSINLNAHMVS